MPDSQNTALSFNARSDRETPSQSLQIIMELCGLTEGWFTAEWIARIIHRTHHGTRILLGKLVRNGILEMDRDRKSYRISNPDIRDRLVKELSETRRSRLHGDILNALVALRRETGCPIHYEVACHAIAARHPDAVRHAFEGVRVCLSMGREFQSHDIIRRLQDSGIAFDKNALHLFWFQEKSCHGNWRAARRILREWRIGQSTFRTDISERIFLHLARCRSRIRSSYPLYRVVARFVEKSRRPELLSLAYHILASEALKVGACTQAGHWASRSLEVFGGNSLDIDRHQILALLGRIALRTGNIAEAERYFIRSLGLRRSGTDRESVAEGLSDMAVLRYVMGDSRRAGRNLDMAWAILEGYQRPERRFEILKTRMEIALADGDLETADELVEKLDQGFEIDPVSLWPEKVIFTMRLALRRSQKKLAARAVREFFANLDRIDPPVVRKMMPYLIEQDLICPGEVEILIRKAAEKVDRWGSAMGRDPLPEILIMRHGCSRSILTTGTLKRLARLVDERGDPVCRAHLAAAARVCMVRPEYLEKIERGLPSREFLAFAAGELLSDLDYYTALSSRSHSEITVESRIREDLIRSGDIAQRISDLPRVARARNHLESLAAPGIGDSVQPGLNLATAMDRIQSSKSWIDFIRNVRETLRELLGICSGEIRLRGLTAGIDMFKWGEGIPLRLARKTLRECELLRRTSERFRTVADTVLCLPLRAGNAYAGELVVRIENGGLREMPGYPEKLQVLARTIALTGSQIEYLRRYDMEKETGGEEMQVFPDGSGIDGQSLGARRLRSFVHRVRNSPSTVHISGETGVGKELVARAIHRLGSRRFKPFIAYNCGASPDALVESELFGHVRGAFTGAVQNRWGIFRGAEGGTVFLDEIADLPSQSQVKLLRVLQEKTVRPVGSDRDMPVDVRIISATNKNLAGEVRAGRFRDDLYYRLMVLHVQVPSLRERREDIPDLVRSILTGLCERMKRPVPELTPGLLRGLLNHHWPGNIRELQNVLEVAVNLTKPGFPMDLIVVKDRLNCPDEGGNVHLTDIMRETETGHLRQILERNGWNMSKAAAVLGISRQGLFKKIRRYGIIRPGGKTTQPKE
ncbi:sigma 54-interacting transcriptional regulator [bacterium]|nr:sigma 54-interacting transcriptional regulator [candidate division CSSED10-310 bacterium]